jgi:hypothetical protein
MEINVTTTKYFDTTHEHTYYATDPAHLVAQMHEMAGTPGSDADWMKFAAEGIAMQYGKPVRCDEPEFFVADLLMCGLLKVGVEK